MTIEEYWQYIFTDSNTNEKKLILFGPIGQCIQYKRKLEELGAKKNIDYIYNNDLGIQGDFFEGIEVIDMDR